jgi:hypothetical protein
MYWENIINGLTNQLNKIISLVNGINTFYKQKT